MTRPYVLLSDTATRLNACRTAYTTYTRNLNAWRADGYPTGGDQTGVRGVSDPTPNAALANGTWWAITEEVDRVIAELARLTTHLELTMRRVPAPEIDLTKIKKQARCSGYGQRYAVCDELAVAAGLCRVCYDARRYAEREKAAG